MLRCDVGWCFAQGVGSVLQEEGALRLHTRGERRAGSAVIVPSVGEEGVVPMLIEDLVEPEVEWGEVDVRGRRRGEEGGGGEGCVVRGGGAGDVVVAVVLVFHREKRLGG